MATLGMVVLGTAMVAGLAAPLSAQSTSIPEGQSCGGLVCDLGLFGHKTAPDKTAPEPAASSLTRQAEVPPAAAPGATAPGAVQARRHVASAKKKRVANAAAPAVPVSRTAAPAAVAANKPPMAQAQAPTGPMAARRSPAAQPAQSTQPSIGVPYMGPSSFSFKPIY